MKLIASFCSAPALIAVLVTALVSYAQEARITSVAVQAGQLNVRWQGPTGWTHVLQSAGSLPAAQWDNVLTVPAAPGVNERSLPLPAIDPQGFYRIELVPPAGPGPRLFFTDLESGPNTGGHDDLGAFVAIYGEGFGAPRGASTVTVGEHEVARYVLWGQDNAARGLDMIVVQLGPQVTSGDLVVTVNGRTSNPLPFTVRSGQIFFVVPDAPNADDANPGTFTQPFRTIYRPREVMQAGDIVYLQGGRITTPDPAGPGWDTILMLDTDSRAAMGTAERPIAYVGYPGASPVLGAPSARRGVLLFTGGAQQTYYVLANLTFTQASDPIALSGLGHRVVGNTVFEAGFDDSGTVSINLQASQLKILGNVLRDNGEAGNKFHHGFYIGGYGTNRVIDFGWNEVRNQRGGRAIQLFGHLDNDWMDEIRIHDNWVSGSELDNIVIGGSDGATEVIGSVSVFNNLIVGAGDAGLRVDDSQGIVLIRNNVLYSNQLAEVRCQRAGTNKVTCENNILYAAPGRAYYAFDPGGAGPWSLQAGHNLCFNAGACEPWEVNSLNADPRFVNPGAGDFRIQPGSPAIDAGMDSGIRSDFMGITRPQGPRYDIGAHEFSPGD
jgi:hypothetical protein